MPREKPDYRAHFERLNELYPDKEMLSLEEIKQIMGWKDNRTVKKYVPLTPLHQASKATIARIMCG